MSTVLSLREQIITRRRRLGLTTSDLAKRAGVSQASICRYERGRIPDDEIVQRLAKALMTNLVVVRPPAKAKERNPPPVVAPAIKGQPTPAEIDAGCNAIRGHDEPKSYIRMYGFDRTGRRGDLIEYTVVIGTSREVQPVDVLAALRTHLGDVRGTFDALEINDDDTA